MPSTSCVLTSRAKDTEGVGASPARATSASPRVSPRVSSTMYGNVHLPLVGLDSAGTEAALLHLARAEGCRSLEPRLLKFLHERSGGNPWHAKEWLLDLLKHDLIVVRGQDTVRGAPRHSTVSSKPSIMKKSLRDVTSVVGDMYIKVGWGGNSRHASIGTVPGPRHHATRSPSTQH